MLADELGGGSNWSARFHGQFVSATPWGVALLKPETFMNRSGQSVRAAVDFYKLSTGDVLVVHDELDVPFGELRFKLGGGEAGHNGLRSITQHLDGKDYYRLRIGIGRPPAEFSGTIADFVLHAFAATEAEQLPDVIHRSKEAIRLFAELGPQAAMNEVNKRR